MTPAAFAKYVRKKTRTNSTTFTDDDILSFMEVRQDDIAQDILKTDEDQLLVPQKASLVADQREYKYPADILSRIKRVEVKLNGSDFIKIEEFDITSYDYPISTETDITNKFSNLEGEAFYDLSRKAITIYSGSITAVTDGLWLWANSYPTTITDLTESSADLSEDPSTTTHGIPRALHGIWARGVIIDYKESRQKPIPLSEREQFYEKDLRKAIETLKHGNLDREIILPAPDDGYDSGFNL